MKFLQKLGKALMLPVALQNLLSSDLCSLLLFCT